MYSPPRLTPTSSAFCGYHSTVTQNSLFGAPAPAVARPSITAQNGGSARGCQGAAIGTQLDQKMATRLEHIGVAVPQCAARVLGKPIGVEPGRSLCVCADRATCASNQRMKSVHARPCRQPARQAYVLVRAGAPPGTRTPNPRIKRSTAGCDDRPSSTDIPSCCPECPRCPGFTSHPVHDPVHGPTWCPLPSGYAV
jgi:hypothetical protein